MDLNRRDAVKFGPVKSARPESKHAIEYHQQNRLESERLRATGGRRQELPLVVLHFRMRSRARSRSASATARPTGRLRLNVQTRRITSGHFWGGAGHPTGRRRPAIGHREKGSAFIRRCPHPRQPTAGARSSQPQCQVVHAKADRGWMERTAAEPATSAKATRRAREDSFMVYSPPLQSTICH